MIDKKHFYKSFPLFGIVGVAEDMTDKNLVWSFSDISSKNLPYKIDIAHIIRMDGAYDDESKYYGKNMRLNISERLISEGDIQYYVDSFGEKHEVIDSFVVGLKLTTDTPEWIKAKSLFNDMNGLRWLTTAVASNVYKGFNSDGYLVYITDEHQKIYRLNRESNNRLMTIEDISGTELKTLYTFAYNSSTGLLNKITDHVNNKDLSYKYKSGKLSEITQNRSASYTIDYDAFFDIKAVESSLGYRAECFRVGTRKTIYVKSLYSSIPGNLSNSPVSMAQWSISYSDDNCIITDIDGNIEHYNFDHDYFECVYIKEENGVVTQAYGWLNYEYKHKEMQYAHIDCLYVPYAEFDKKLTKIGECSKIIMDVNYRMQKREITGRIIGVNSDGVYSTENITTTYFYNIYNQCYKEESIVTLNLCNGTKKQFPHVTTYAYDKKTGWVQKTESYVGYDYAKEREKIVETVGYKFYDDGSYSKRTSRYRGDSGANGYRTEEFYDTENRLTAEKDPTWTYDIKYNYYTNTTLLRRIYHPGIREIKYMYDWDDKLTNAFYTTNDEEGNSVDIGNRIERPLDEVTQLISNDQIDFTYDEKRRVKKIAIAGNKGSKTLSYSEQTTNDVAEDVVTAVNENGQTIKYVSAKDGSYEKMYYDDQLQIQNSYDVKGQLIKTEDKLSNEIVTQSYNAVGQLISYTEKHNNANKVKQTYVYDEYGNISSMTISGNAAQSYTYDYEDKSDRRFKGMSFGGVSEELTYDNLDRVITKTVKNNGKEIYTKTYEYRDVKQGTSMYATTMPQSIKYEKTGQIKKKVEYKYTDLGNWISEILYDGKSVAYTYYEGRFSKETNNLLGISYSVSCDDNGNILYRKNQIDWTTKTATYDGDRLMSYNGKSCVYDGMGNPTTYLGKAATWKGRQMMSFNGNTFKYNGRGRRTNKNSIAFTYDSRGNLIKQSNGLEFYYDIDGIAACKYNGTMYYYMTDAQGNVIGIVDRNGNVVVQYWYDAWGNHKVVSANGTTITSSTHIGNVNPFRYRGYYYDTETGLYFLQTRYYDPEVGRFLNRDSVQYADPQTFGGLDLYAYCLNNPVEYVDPDGTFISLFIGLTVSFIIGFGTSTISQGVQYGWDNINWAQSAVDGLFSVASTALAATGINFLTSIGIGMISGFSQYAIDSNFHNESLNLEGAISAIILGGAAGA